MSARSARQRGRFLCWRRCVPVPAVGEEGCAEEGAGFVPCTAPFDTAGGAAPVCAFAGDLTTAGHVGSKCGAAVVAALEAGAAASEEVAAAAGGTGAAA